MIVYLFYELKVEPQLHIKNIHFKVLTAKSNIKYTTYFTFP